MRLTAFHALEVAAPRVDGTRRSSGFWLGISRNVREADASPRSVSAGDVALLGGLDLFNAFRSHPVCSIVFAGRSSELEVLDLGSSDARLLRRGHASVFIRSSGRSSACDRVGSFVHGRPSTFSKTNDLQK